MYDNLSAAEYAAWQAFFSIEPFPQARADLRAAQIIQAVLATTGVKKLPEVARILPDWWGDMADARRQSPEQIRQSVGFIKAARARRKK